MIVNLHVIIVDRAAPDQLNTVHEAIKEEADGWWHRFENTWVVGGLSSAQWRDLVKEHIHSGASVMVLRLPDEQAKRNWAFFGPRAKERAAWLHRNIR